MTEESEEEFRQRIASIGILMDRRRHGRQTWDEPRAIDSLPPGHPDRYARSPDEAERIMARHGLLLHPSDDSGVKPPLGEAPLDPKELDREAFGSASPEIVARSLGKPVPRGALTREQIQENLRELLPGRNSLLPSEKENP